MKIYPFLVVFCLVGCKNAIKNDIAPTYLASNALSEKSIGNSNTIVTTKEDLIGFWKGDLFKKDKNHKYIDEEMRIESRNPKYRRGNTPQLMLLIKSITNTTVEGKIFVYGDSRNVKGVLTEKEGVFQIDIKEVKSEEALQLSFNIAQGTKSLEGNWEKVKKESYDKNNAVVLEKKIFQYNPDSPLEYRFINWDKFGKMHQVYEYEDSLGKKVKEKYEFTGNLTVTDTVFSLNPSKSVFQKDLVENLSRGDLRILKNLIYARHGYIFKNKSWSVYFNNQTWYIPVSENVTKDFTEIEKKNIDLLERYEKNAKEYYQVFGR